MVMNERQRTIAQFYARLASIPSLEQLREGERLLLLDDFHAIGPLLDEFMPVTVLTTRAGVKPTDSDFPRAPTDWELLVRHHTWARTYIADLLDGQAVTLRFHPTWRLNSGKLVENWNVEKLGDGLLFGLLSLIKLTPFPFRRCPVCQTIFVPVRKQKYCSPNCTYKGVETARKDERKVYMKEYQARKRKEAQKLKRTRKRQLRTQRKTK